MVQALHGMEGLDHTLTRGKHRKEGVGEEPPRWCLALFFVWMRSPTCEVTEVRITSQNPGD